MPVVTLTEEDQQARLDHARQWLASQVPELSSESFLSGGQKAWALAIVIATVASFALFPLDSGIAVVALLTACYVAILVNRVAMTIGSLRRPNLVQVSDEDALSVADESLPIYTVLVPLYREASVVPQLIANLRDLSYPRDRLDVKLLVEHDDVDTLTALLAHGVDEFDVVVVPDGAPRTKPRALNYGLTLARGDLVTIFDAEDRPDTLQLRKAAIAFQRVPARVGCLQSRLEYWNIEQNVITRWFGIEYLQWFRLLLPGLAASGSPVPLGGTSNHMRRELLEAVGAWDPYNVTEDADLGIRLHRAGYRCAVLDSITWEEANSDYVNWNAQRSRWYKGYLQTWIVHMRRPRLLLGELGWRGLLEFNAFVGGTPVLAVLNLAFWALTVAWFAGHVDIVRDLFPTAVYYPALFCFVFGNLAMVYLYMISARLTKLPSLVWVSCLVPLYWFMMGIAALKAVWQLLVSRSFWEKTVHGLVGDPGRAQPTAAPGAVQYSTVSAFTSPRAPVLAVRLNSPRGRLRWRVRGVSSIGVVLRVLSATLLVFVLYLVVLAGLGTAGRSGSGALGHATPRRPVQGTEIARIVIRSVGIDHSVVEGATSETLNQSVGHVTGTALPGERGDAVLIGHDVAFGAAFAHLSSVKIGEQVTVDIGGGVATYRVTAKDVRGDGPLALASAHASELTLVTSVGGWNLGALTVVQARLTAKTGVRFVGTQSRPAGRVHVAGFNGGPFGVALLWLATLIVAAFGGIFIRRRLGGMWTIALLTPVLLAAICEVCLNAGHALPLAF